MNNAVLVIVLIVALIASTTFANNCEVESGGKKYNINGLSKANGYVFKRHACLT
jgi:hypothetical protein